MGSISKVNPSVHSYDGCSYKPPSLARLPINRNGLETLGTKVFPILSQVVVQLVHSPDSRSIRRQSFSVSFATRTTITENEANVVYLAARLIVNIVVAFPLLVVGSDSLRCCRHLKISIVGLRVYDMEQNSFLCLMFSKMGEVLCISEYYGKANYL
jgi:hypothetical protein